MPLIRPSRDDDLDAITRIYGHHVLTGTGTFETTPPSVADMTARRADVLGKGLPWLVVEDGGQVLGFAYGNWFKPRPAYRFSPSKTRFTWRPRPRAKAWAARLLAELLTAFERAGVRRVMAVIGDSANAGSVGLHTALGFERVGVVPSCGWKFGKWLDIVIMQRSLGAGDGSPPDASEGAA